MVDVQHLAAKVGITQMDVHEAVQLLNKMSLTCSPVGRESQLKVFKEVWQWHYLIMVFSCQVTIPPTRHDILHECDLAEDLALAYGYNAIPVSMPQSNTVAQPFPLNKLSDQLRTQLAVSGWTEVLNFALCSTEDVGHKMRRPAEELASVVKIANPKTLEFQVDFPFFNALNNPNPVGCSKFLIARNTEDHHQQQGHALAIAAVRGARRGFH
jgi:phenylalanyl-tRNA synthetase beta subunit